MLRTHIMHARSHLRRFCQGRGVGHVALTILAPAAVALGCSAAGPGSTEQTFVVQPQDVVSHAGFNFGVRCQNDFENGWIPHIETYSMCDSFTSTMRQSGTQSFYYDLKDGPDYTAGAGFTAGSVEETDARSGGVDSVRLFLVDTHANAATAEDAQLGMWAQHEYVHSSALRLGSYAWILAVYGCDAFKTSDGHLWNRWIGAFAGGLKVGLGAHGIVYDDGPQKGGEFASRLENGEPVARSWNEAVWYANNNNTPTSATSGADAKDCWSRMGMSLSGVAAAPALRDGDIGYLCWSEWNS